MRAIFAVATAFLCLFLLPVPAHAGEALIAAAQRDLGKTGPQLGLPARLWCADALNRWVRKTGRKGTGSRAARSFASYGTRSSGKRGDIVVFPRGRGGHVGVILGDCGNGSIRVISGNAAGRRVTEACYPRSRAIAFRAPSGSAPSFSFFAGLQ